MRVVILGGGLTGLTAAYYLQRENIDYVVLEKEQTVGGLCRSVTQNGFIFDYTGHFIHFDKTQTVAKNFVFELLKGKLIKLNRNAKIYTKFANTKDKLIPYPFQVNIKFLLPNVLKECVTDLIWANILGQKNKSENFHEWLLAKFGAGISKYFFEPYNKKIWGTNLNNISISWVKKFVPEVDLETVLNSIIFDKDVDNRYGYNFEFYYPSTGGIQELINSILLRLQAEKIITSAEVVGVNAKKKKVTFVKNGRSETINYDFVISTIPLIELLKILDIDGIKIYTNRLKYVSVMCFNIATSRPIMKGVHWIYFPDREISFYRVGFYHNISRNLVPAGCGSMYVEISTKQVSQNKINSIKDQVVRQLIEVRILNSDKEILFVKPLCLPYAYVLYDNYREKVLPVILSKLKKHKIYSIGRYGAWKYSYMSENITDAIETVNILKRKYKR